MTNLETKLAEALRRLMGTAQGIAYAQWDAPMFQAETALAEYDAQREAESGQRTCDCAPLESCTRCRTWDEL